MPTYVYACKQCDGRLEVVQKMSDDPLRDCPDCSGQLRRVLFPPAVVYKGTGFYTTDYKNGGRKEESTPPASSTGDTTSTAAKSETPSTPTAAT